jgi:hypothetical protein
MVYRCVKSTLKILLIVTFIIIFFLGRSEAANNGCIVLSWISAGNDESAGGANYYVIKYSSNPITEANWNKAIKVQETPAPIAAGLIQQLIVTGLETGQRYFIAMKAYNSFEVASPMSAVVSTLASGENTQAIDSIQDSGSTIPNQSQNLQKADISGSIPNEYFLNQSYPNPFNPTTTIAYGIPRNAQVSIVIYDLLGQKVQTLVNSNQSAGIHQVTWDASNLPSGVYLYQIKAGNYSASKKMQLLK